MEKSPQHFVACTLAADKPLQLLTDCTGLFQQMQPETLQFCQHYIKKDGLTSVFDGQFNLISVMFQKAFWRYMEIPGM